MPLVRSLSLTLALFFFLQLTTQSLELTTQALASQTYPVPWKLIQPEDQPLSQGMAVYWFPASQAEIDNSSLRFSRTLVTYSQQCVTMGIVDFHTSLGRKLVSDQKVPIAVLAGPDGKVIATVKNENGVLNVNQVEGMVQTEMTAREEAINRQMVAAETKAKSDKQGAVQLYQAVYGQRCMFPAHAKDAARELKKLGVTIP